MDKKMLPVGLDSFEKIRRLGYYYMDKTLLIQDVLTNRGDVNLFTRPRRFGKTLNMSMLWSFFEIGSDKSLFNGLAISEGEAALRGISGEASRRFPFAQGRGRVDV